MHYHWGSLIAQFRRDLEEREHGNKRARGKNQDDHEKKKRKALKLLSKGMVRWSYWVADNEDPGVILKALAPNILQGKDIFQKLSSRVSA